MSRLTNYTHEHTYVHNHNSWSELSCFYSVRLRAEVEASPLTSLKPFEVVRTAWGISEILAFRKPESNVEKCRGGGHTTYRGVKV